MARFSPLAASATSTSAFSLAAVAGGTSFIVSACLGEHRKPFSMACVPQALIERDEILSCRMLPAPQNRGGELQRIRGP